MRLMIADDHDLVRETLAMLLSRELDATCDQADTLPSALSRIAKGVRYDLVLLDYVMPGMNGLEGLRRAVKASGDSAVALISGLAPDQIARDALNAGARGFITKTMPAKSVVSAVRFMLAGETFAPATLLVEQGREPTPAHPMLGNLTARERQALDALCRGQANKEIARDLGLSEVTVKLHVRTLCRKLGARNRTHAAMLARDLGLDAVA